MCIFSADADVMSKYVESQDSFSFRHEASGYEELPSFLEMAPDVSVRNSPKLVKVVSSLLSMSGQPSMAAKEPDTLKATSESRKN